MTYDATCIRILDHDEIQSRWTWANAAELATRYKRPQAWIEKGLRACEAAGVPHDYFVDRYLRRLPVPLDESVQQAFKELIRE